MSTYEQQIPRGVVLRYYDHEKSLAKRKRRREPIHDTWLRFNEHFLACETCPLSILSVEGILPALCQTGRKLWFQRREGARVRAE